MDTSTSGGGRHRRRIRIAVPVAAAGLAAVVAGALLVSSANAATGPAAPSLPAVHLAGSVPSQAVLKKRVEGALASDGIAGHTARKSSLSASTTPAHVDPKIIGGTTTAITTAPWMAQLWYYDAAKDIGFFCGGSVVSPTKILTAAHCTKDENGKTYDWAANGTVITGTSQLPSETSLNGGVATGVSRQWTHPSFSPSTLNNDVAVLTLSTAVTAKPIRMTTSDDTASYAAGTKATLYGWGRTTSTTNDISEVLKTATLPINSDSTCNTAMRSVLGGVDAFVEGHMICAGAKASGSDTGTTSACNGDSGGPLIVNGRIVGVVSWGVDDCVTKGAYSVFSKVSAYVGAAWPRVEDANLSGDQRADLWVRSAATKTGYEKDSNGTSFGARQSWSSWDGVNVVLQTDLNRDGYQDFVVRESASGDVTWMHWLPATGKWAKDKLFTNWKTRTRIVAPGDLTGDGLPDILSVDSAGVLWEYPGKGNGTFSTRVQVGTGWNQYNSVRGHGDFTGDGKADLIVRSKTGSYMYLYKGTGKTGSGAFSPRIKVRTWSGYNAFDAVGDVTGDGKADFLARTPAGTLYLYPGTGKATSEIFATRISVGTGFDAYDIFG
ncbi:trypsin-like serine protease [Streptomyces sp. NPDC127038]|uniref:trypsin-like serine protease n=1 Tax=Streptomyces sp. NPDC127038 TaxID=3347114 RepID=UPI00365BF049